MTTMRRINVIDMYHGNVVHTSDFAALKAAGIYAIIHKASQGLHYSDPAFHDRVKAANDAGLLVGAYHFLDSTNPEDQAAHFMDLTLQAADMPSLSIWADFEDNGNSSASLQSLVLFMRACNRVMPNVQCGLYSGNRIRETLKPHTGGFQDASLVGIEQFFQTSRLWLAEYGPAERVPYPWDHPIVKTSNESTPLSAPGVFLWQYTEQGRVNPLVGKTDGNFYEGSFEELQTRWLA